MSDRTQRFDVAVIGAGAAGLAAAAELSERGCQVCVLEARDRIGGRIFTRHEPHLAVRLELGAEFVHGKAHATSRWIADRNTELIDAAEQRWILRGDKLRPADDLFPELKSRLGRVRRPRKDLPFSEFLEGPARSHLSPRIREFALMLVEGYDAADATRISTLATLDEWCGESSADAATFRPQRGYESLLHALAGALDPKRVHIKLSTIVREVRWKRGEVAIAATQQGRAEDVVARQAIVTLPLGVLQLPPQAPNGVRFVPTLDAKQEALAALATGPVIKLVLQFRRAFWEQVDGGRYAYAAFFHAPKAAFPTFWTMLPARASVLTAWAAGPAAAKLAGLGESELVRAALDCLGKLFPEGDRVAADFQCAYLHDWQADPFACGAYSYVVAGGGKGRERLAEPLDDTLFFAGEAADTDGESGTVAGALASGERAVEEWSAVVGR
jgi:monoamine oxidase